MPEPKHIICIHGVADISQQWHRARIFFESNEFNVYFFDYDTLSNHLDIPAIAEELAVFIKKELGGDDYQIFAHSQGGLIAEWFDVLAGDRKLKRIITIGTPFQGNTLPLLTPQSVLKRLPASRKQIEDLACMSTTISELIKKRVERQECSTQYVTLISHFAKILGIHCDGLVSVCAGNRNAGYYLIEGEKIYSLPVLNRAGNTYVISSHWPLSIVRQLQPNHRPNRLSSLLLSALNGEVIPGNGIFKPSQSAFVFPAQYKSEFEASKNLKKIISRPTKDGKYIVTYYDTLETEPDIALCGQPIRLTQGAFTYLFESGFLNTKTSVSAAH